jgi:hypothetical protein
MHKMLFLRNFRLDHDWIQTVHDKPMSDKNSGEPLVGNYGHYWHYSSLINTATTL